MGLSFSNEGGWLLTMGNVTVPAHEDGAQSISSLACLLPYSEKFEASSFSSEEDLATFGLQSPKKRLLITADADYTIDIGDTAPSGTDFYVRASTEPNTIYTIPNMYLKMLVPRYMELRQRIPFTSLSRGGKLNITFNDATLTLEKEGSDWREKNGLLTSEEVGALVADLQFFSYTNYRGPIAFEQMSSYGLDFPEVTIEWQKPNESVGERYDLTTFNGRFQLTFKVGPETYLAILDTKRPRALFQKLGALSNKLSQTPGEI